MSANTTTTPRANPPTQVATPSNPTGQSTPAPEAPSWRDRVREGLQEQREKLTEDQKKRIQEMKDRAAGEGKEDKPRGPRPTYFTETDPMAQMRHKAAADALKRAMGGG